MKRARLSALAFAGKRITSWTRRSAWCRRWSSRCRRSRRGIIQDFDPRIFCGSPSGAFVE